MSPNPSEPPVALVTGAAQRIGATIARTLHGAGYRAALHRSITQRWRPALPRPGTSLTLRKNRGGKGDAQA